MAMEADCQQLRKLATQFFNEAQKTHKAGGVQEAVTHGLLNLLQLKEDSRALALEAEGHREDTAQCKARLEHAHLQLQNLLYEKQYYEKEIHACQSYRSNYTDEQITLVPSEEFLAQASKEVVARIGDDPHNLMLQRLSHEHGQRKGLEGKLEKLKKEKAALRQEVEKKRKVLEDLQQQLQGLEDTAKPLQTILAPHLSLRSMARNADLLPLPLYIIYSQLAAVKEALSLPIRVAILGSPVEAESFAKSQVAEPGDADVAAGADYPPAKRPRMSPAPATMSHGDDPYKVHPLSVLLEVQRENNGRLQTFMSVKFQFLLNLKLVTAHSEVRDDNLLLSALFPGDDGSGTSYESLAQLQGGSFQYDASRPARPYRWCQHLAGLDFAPPLPLATQLQPADQAVVLDGLDTYRRQQRVIQVIDRLRTVKTGDEALKKIVTSLTTSPNPPNTARYPKLPVTAITSCEEIKTQAAAAAAAAAAANSSREAANAKHGAGSSGSRGAGQAAGRSLLTYTLTAASLQQQPAEKEADKGGRSAGNTPAPDEGEARAAQDAPAAAEKGEATADAIEEGEEGAADDKTEHERGDDEGEEGEQGATELISAYLLADVLDAGGDQRQAGGAPAKAAAPKPPSRLYRLILANRTLEAELLARVYLEYPLRPPLLLVKSVYEPSRERKGQPKVVDDVNLTNWLETEANATALRAVPEDAPLHALQYQLLHLRLAMDEVAAMYAADAVSSSAATPDLMALLQSKQKLRGRDRHLMLPVLPAC